ncbi:MAG: OsmC family protein [Clostridiales bacterium]|nr:OsmC family protein [Clostridiales bacterium]
MKPVQLKLIDGLHLEGHASSGHSVSLDAGATVGGQGKGFMPSELLLTALGGCTSMDILSLLRKFGAPPTSFEVELEGIKRETHPKSFTNITAVYRIEGETSAEQALKAVRSSYEKYSVVANSLRAAIEYKIILNGVEID